MASVFADHLPSCTKDEFKIARNMNTRLSAGYTACGGKGRDQLRSQVSVVLPSLKLTVAPETGWLEDGFPFGIAFFQGLVSFRECILGVTNLMLGQTTTDANCRWHKDIHTQMSCKPIEHIFAHLRPQPVCVSGFCAANHVGTFRDSQK